MRAISCTALLLATTLSLTQTSSAGEGMWTPDQLPEIAAPLKAAGLDLDPAQFADLGGKPMGAIVSLGGCSASFVSSQGLVVTNHHCAYGAIQLNSTEQNNLLRDGFYAATHSDELSAGPAARIFVTREIRDVTRQVLKSVNQRMTDRQAFDAVEAARKRLVANCEQTPGQRCSVASFFGGVVYRLVVQMEIRDVRLVYAPPEAIGKFGGDVDNWMWPRHTGDFAFYRAYVSADGRPADFSADNKPYQPEQHLRIAQEALKDGDFVMVAGYPGATSRYRLADEIDAVIDWTYPKQIQRFTDMMAIVDAAGPAGSDVAIKYAATMASWKNARKNFSGQLQGFARADTLGKKRHEEAALEAWLQEQDTGTDSLAELRARLALGRQMRERDLVLTTLAGGGLFSTARSLHRLSIERERPDAAREIGFQVRDESRIEAGLRQLDRRYDAKVDRQLMAYALARYLELPALQRLPELDAWLGLAAARSETESSEPTPAPVTIDAALTKLYAGTRLGDLNVRLDLMKSKRQTIESSDDTFVQWVVAIGPALQRIEDDRKTYEGALLRLQPAYMRAMLDYRKSRGLATYPDANGTLRITFGNVSGVSPRDGLTYVPFTSTVGIREKHSGVNPFDATAPQLAAISEARWGERAEAGASGVAVNFLADLDVTGGNSGSATLNSKGELVGLIFDMTWESVASNWVFNPALTRTIHVDHRYMLWVMEQVYPAPAVLRELASGSD
ncbi:MAG: S46 family peptidase [Pseudomarimonas sp.]